MEGTKENVTRRLALYMQQNKISIPTVANHTNIPETKLRPDTIQRLSATEFLELCSYLRVRPEDI